jgi:hypothetical protein
MISILPPLFANNAKNPFWVALFILVVILVTEFIVILALNSGVFVFTLDDPYIHMALAENILHGHYGVNIDEYSSPSSSILWPFIIAPLSVWSFSSYLVLIVNIIFASATLYIYFRVLSPEPGENCAVSINNSQIMLMLLVALILSTNLVGLVYTGMEHSLQLFVSTLIVYGFVRELESKTIKWWFVVAVVVAPLIRYECLALSIPALLYLFLSGYRATSLWMAVVLIAIVSAFSSFLVNIGLNYLPNSVIAKSIVVLNEGRLNSIIYHVINSQTFKKGVLLTILAIVFGYIAIVKSSRKRESMFAACIVLAIVMHICVGRFGWYGRYETYIWSSALLALLYIYKTYIYTIGCNVGLNKLAPIVVLAILAINHDYLNILFTTPLASNNVYEQQYQLHRFVSEYYNNPVAVNDLGYVSYKNDNYVLDLHGLASSEALNNRLHNRNSNWIEDITKSHNTKMAIVDEGRLGKIPKVWRKIGELHLGKKRITPSSNVLSFYIVDCDSLNDTYRRIVQFANTIPDGVVFKLYKITLESCVTNTNY